jgi:hypothetical protein
MSACECNVSLGNTGNPSCEPIFSVMRNLIVVKKYADDGTLNKIDLTATLNQAYFTARVNDVDASKRWFPIKDLLNVTSEKADSVFEEFEDTSKVKIREGVRSISALIAKVSPTYLGKLKGYECDEVGVFVVGVEGELMGSKGENADYMYPIEVDSASWNPTMVFGTDSTIQKINLAFDWALSQRDEDLIMILASDVSPVNLLNLSGLLDVSATYSTIGLSAFTATLKTEYGSALNPILVKGLIITDFALYNVTDSLAVTIISVTEVAGVYTFTYAAQGTGEVLRLTPTKNGYDFTSVVASTITLP